LEICTWEASLKLGVEHQRCADADIRGPGSADFAADADGPRIHGSKKHICGRGPSADLKPQVLFAGPTSNGSANVPVPSNLRTYPYLDTAVGYERKPV